MNNQAAYNLWAEQYDTNKNRTRDMEAKALRSVLTNVPFSKVLEIGCGTGKNAAWLIRQAASVTSVDFSEAMLEKARAKPECAGVQFIQADILQPWSFTQDSFDLAVFSLVLEHIEQLEPIFQELSRKMQPGGFVYIGELHPFKQYQGSLARFDTDAGRVELTCFVHHLSEFTSAAALHGFSTASLNEWWDEDAEPGAVPRILTLLLRKN